MKREDVSKIFEKATDEQINAILDINSKDIGNAKAKAEAEKIAIKENSDLFDGFVEAVDKCEIEHNKKIKDKKQYSQYLEEALRLSTKINTKMLDDTQKKTFEAYKAKLNSLLKG